MYTARFSDSGRSPYRDPPGRNMGSGTETSLEGAMDQAAG